MAKPNMHNRRLACKVKMYLLCNQFENLLGEIMSDQAYLLSIQIHNLKYIFCIYNTL